MVRFASIVGTLALLLIATPVAQSPAIPAVVKPFPSGLTGTLVFHSDLRGPGNPEGRSRIYTLDLARGIVSALTVGSQWRDENPRWSPDGKRIAFKSNRSNGAYDIFVMNAHGSHVQRFTDHPANDHDPAWAPDGQSLIFMSERDSEITWWMDWPNAKRDHGTFCVSCHTVVPYVMARPALAKTLGDTAPSAQEQKLYENVATRVRLWGQVEPFYPDQTRGIPKTSESRGTESVLNALILSTRDASAGALSAAVAALGTAPGGASDGYATALAVMALRGEAAPGRCADAHQSDQRLTGRR